MKHVGTPSEKELQQLSQTIVSILRSKSKTTFKTGRSASKLRAELGVALGVPMKKILSIQTFNWMEMGDVTEAERFYKMFQVWKTMEDRPMRILLVGALLDSSINSIIPESLVKSFSIGMH